jgi:hypothetical protein
MRMTYIWKTIDLLSLIDDVRSMLIPDDLTFVNCLICNASIQYMTAFRYKDKISRRIENKS